MKCSECSKPIDLKESVTCIHCGHDHTAEMSDPEDKMEAMVEAASRPSLSALFKAGKDRGLITAQDAGSGPPT